MSFSNIKGQEQAVRILQGYIKQERLRAGLLFIGPEGVGKKLTALILAKAVNCQEQGEDSCDQCPSCLKIERGQHPDIHILEPEEEGLKIEAIRQLQRDISLRPYEGRQKVFIINNCHRLTAEASGALLKILEEPPGNTLLILISDKPGLLFKTVVSRCKALKFAPLARNSLQEILQKEFGLDLTRAHYLAYASEGRLGRALRLKELDALREKNAVIDRYLFSRSSSFEQMPKQDKTTLRHDLNILATWFRDLYFLKAGLPHAEIIHGDRLEDLLRQGARFSVAELDEIMDSIPRAIFLLERNINLKLLLYELRSQIWKG
jgi:DNA polymerase III subunit delta'